jgi:hypothetical protein
MCQDLGKIMKALIHETLMLMAVINEEMKPSNKYKIILKTSLAHLIVFRNLAKEI